MDMNSSAQPTGGLSAEDQAESPLKIFINYRHDDMPFAASTLYRELKGPFGTENIFFDGGTLRPGMQFLEEIKSHLGGVGGAFLALIGSKWVPTMMAHRQQGGDDYVVKEIELALRHGWTIIPVLLNDASLPDPFSLPLSIRALPDYQVARLRQTSLDEDVGDLRARLHELRARISDAARSPDGPVTGKPEPNGAKIPAPGEMSADDEHYQSLIDEADNLVIFLGAGVNSDDHGEPFQAGTSMLPDDTDLAEYLAAKARLKSGQRELAGVAQYARMIRGEPNMFKWVKQAVTVDSEPGPVHEYLARFPKRLEQLELQKRYQMIVTPKFDVALERAFRKEEEPFDVAVYMAPGTEHAGRFVHIQWGSVDPQPIRKANEYEDFPIAVDGELTRTVIVRINGAVDDLRIGYRWPDNFVITEDHYIDYLGGRSAAEVVPGQILAKLKQASCLFLGYDIADWRLRVFLHWIWGGERPSSARHWAVARNPSPLERQFWQNSAVSLYGCRLADYVRGFDTFLEQNRDDLI